jgi:hypothetical protein
MSISIAAISRYSAASSRLVFADLVDVDQILARHLGHRDVEDVEVLLADQVEQQVQRPLEGVEEDLEGVGRDVQIQRQLHHRLAVKAGQHLQLELFGDWIAGLGQRQSFLGLVDVGLLGHPALAVALGGIEILRAVPPDGTTLALVVLELGLVLLELLQEYGDL